MELYKAPKEDIERHNHNKCCDEHKYDYCCPKSPCAYPILFECSQGTGVDIPKLDSSKAFAPRSLGCVTIDTSCLKNPVVKFDFDSVIKYKDKENDQPTTLIFGLFKTCDNRQEIPCGTWEFAITFTNTPLQELTTSFNFTHCECNSCPGCCTYTVKIIDAISDRGDEFSVCNTSLSVMAKSGH
ncbi:DUF4489 domain-containing protein [Clostridium amazonitimonense]|uniref:DUF4489 domain-containing protein n=1 Tax=Clostridium amazonitimonense TaxID=1499689 RepID=UPI000509C805|nr:DUF4489 domain-containing protein [Clostridium amazonitimonense]